MGTLRASCIQLNASPDVGANLAIIEARLRAAKEAGAALAVLPENAVCMAFKRSARLAAAFPENEHPALPRFAAFARELGLWLVAGSVAIKSEGGKFTNRCYVFAPDGGIAARYDKIHLYDADPKPGERYRESDDCLSGNRAVLVETPFAPLGLTICYDLRFPHLYRDLAKAGAKIITVPAAFTRTTGMAHWHVLLRARAIETGCFILAAAQTGTHDGGRQTYGHSLIISPWGEVLADAGEVEGVITATLDLGRVDEARAALPALGHDRGYAQP